MSKIMPAVFNSVLLLLVVSAARADNVCTVVDELPNKVYKIRVNNTNLIAITADQAKEKLKLQEEIKALKAKLTAKETRLAMLEKEKQHYDKVVQDQSTYIKGLENARNGYRDLVKDYKKLIGDPWLTLDVGLGATGGDTEPAAFVGLGIRKVRVWGFVQEANSGIILGTSLPLIK